MSLGLHGVGGGSLEVVKEGGGTSGEGEVQVGKVVVRMRGGKGRRVKEGRGGGSKEKGDD